MRDHALRKVVTLDSIGDRQALQLRHQSPVPAYYTPNEALVTKMIETEFLAVSLAGGVDQRQVPRLWDHGSALHFGRQITLFDGNRDFFGKADTHKPARRERIALAYQTNRLTRADYFSTIERSEH